MIWTMAAIAAGFAALAAVAMLALGGRRGRGRGDGSGAMAAGDAHVALYGLSSEEAARFHQSAREHTRLHNAQWSRDYLPGAGALPGRVAGIPRALRVRR